MSINDEIAMTIYQLRDCVNENNIPHAIFLCNELHDMLVLLVNPLGCQENI